MRRGSSWAEIGLTGIRMKKTSRHTIKLGRCSRKGAKTQCAAAFCRFSLRLCVFAWEIFLCITSFVTFPGTRFRAVKVRRLLYVVQLSLHSQNPQADCRLIPGSLPRNHPWDVRFGAWEISWRQLFRTTSSRTCDYRKLAVSFASLNTARHRIRAIKRARKISRGASPE